MNLAQFYRFSSFITFLLTRRTDKNSSKKATKKNVLHISYTQFWHILAKQMTKNRRFPPHNSRTGCSICKIRRIRTKSPIRATNSTETRLFAHFRPPQHNGNLSVVQVKNHRPSGRLVICFSLIICLIAFWLLIHRVCV